MLYTLSSGRELVESTNKNMKMNFHSRSSEIRKTNASLAAIGRTAMDFQSLHTKVTNKW